MILLYKSNKVDERLKVSLKYRPRDFLFFFAKASLLRMSPHNVFWIAPVPPLISHLPARHMDWYS